MNRRRVILGAITLMILLLNGCVASIPMQVSEVDEAETKAKTLKIAYERDIKNVLEKSIAEVKNTQNFKDDVSGIVVPHHLLMAQTLAELFNGLKDKNPDIIVLLSPNHGSTIESSVYTTTLPLQTYKGLISNSAITGTLADHCQVVVADRIISQEYGLTNLLPYIQASGWNGELIPLVIARETTTKQMDSILQTLLKEANGRDVFFIASIDFSHGLKALESRSRDAETKEWINTRNYSAILSSGPEYMDNPSGLYIWLHAMSSTELIFHGESGSMFQNLLNEAGTSYLIYTGSID